MSGIRVSTRVRAWLLRHLRGRPSTAASWDPVVSGGPPVELRLGPLQVSSRPVAAGRGGTVAAVFEVSVGIPGDSRKWSSRYGIDPGVGGAEAAADAALDDLFEAFEDLEGWTARATSGMTPEETEAMTDSPAMRLDLRASQWIGPHLGPFAERRRAAGGWFLA